MDSALVTNLWWMLGVLAVLGINVAALIVIPRRRKPTAAMAWLLLILLLPFIGILIYLLIGNSTLPKKRRAEQARIDAVLRDVAPLSARAIGEDWPASFAGIVRQNLELTSLPALDGNRFELVEDYQG